MKFIQRWRERISQQHAADTTIEQRRRIRRNQEKFVTPADIEQLEEQMVPWLRDKRRRRK